MKKNKTKETAQVHQVGQAGDKQNKNQYIRNQLKTRKKNNDKSSIEKQR